MASAASAAPKTSMFAMSAERYAQLNNRMTAQYSGVTVLDDDVRKRVAPTVVRSVRWMRSQLGDTAAFPIRVDEEYWRAYM